VCKLLPYRRDDHAVERDQTSLAEAGCCRLPADPEFLKFTSVSIPFKIIKFHTVFLLCIVELLCLLILDEARKIIKM
jgi:hypothetical protein